MKENSIRRAVREGRAALGTGLKEFASRGVPWIIEQAGFDYFAIDHEHGAFDMETIANLASWFQATNVTVIVRIHKSFAHLIPAFWIRASWASRCPRWKPPKRRARSSAWRSIRRSETGVSPARGRTRDTKATAPATPPNTRRGPTRTSLYALRSSRSRAWRMSRRSRRSKGST